VFFNRFGKQASSIPHPSISKTVAEDKTARTTQYSAAEDSAAQALAGKNSAGKKSDGKNDGKSDGDGLLRRRAVALALAVQFALPVGMLSRSARVRAASPTEPKKEPTDTAGKKPAGSFEAVFGTTRDAMPHLSASAGSVGDSFQTGIDQILAGDYDKAVTTLQLVPVDNLSIADSNIVDDMVSRTRKAATAQRESRTELITGQEAATQRHYTEAAKHLRLAMENSFADTATREAAARQLASVRAAIAKSTVPMDPIQPDVTAKPVMLAQVPAPTDTPAATGPAAPGATAPAAPAAAAPAAPAPAAPAPVAPVAPAPAGDDAGVQAALDAAVKFKNIQKQKDQYDAMKLVEKARAERSSGHMQEALDDFDKARRLDPSNAQAKTGFEEISSILNLPPMNARPGGLENDVAVRKQAILYHFNDSLSRAEIDTNDQKWVDAQKDIEQADVWAKHDTTLFLQPEINDFNTRIEHAKLDLERAKAEAASKEASETAGNIARDVDKKQRQYEKDKEKTITGLIQDARNYTDEGKYIEALAVVESIQRLDENNAYAGGVKQFLEDRAHNQEQRKYQQDFNQEFNNVLNAAIEKQIPYSDIIRYSPDWPTISEERDAEVKADRGEDADSAALNALLEKKLPTLKVNANSLSDVIDYLRDVSGANIYVDWPALERASIARDAPVTANLHDIKFSKALQIIFESVQGEDDDKKLGYTLDDGVITISTKKELSKNTVTRRYDINDLLFVAPDYNNAPDLSLQNASQGQSGGGGGGGGGQGGGGNLFTNSNNSNNNGDKTQDRANRVDEIKKYITDNVDTTSWKDNGGDVGQITSSPLRAILLITQTPEAHRKVQSVLDSLRASQALQGSSECRFLIVKRNYLEDIGVNADFEFNPLQNPANARSGVNSSRFTPISITQTGVTDNTTFRDANGNVVANSSQGSRTLDWISNVGNAAVPGSIPANPADYPNPLVVSGSYVDNFTVTFLIRAVQANQNTTSLTAPRLTLFSGQRAVLIVQTQQAYVSNLTPVVAPGAALFDPTVSTTTATGVVLSVQATVSPDRKYVFLDLQPQLARLRALVPFSISAVVTPVTNSITPTTPQIVQGTLQLPTIDLTIVRTSVSVPDGATLLLGGQTLAAETTREQGVPVLSKIPFLKRLFTNRATAQDEQILLILVKPTILIQHEQEIKQFPQLSSKVNG